MEILGIDIGGTGIKGAVVNTTTGETITERIRLLTPKPATPEAVADVVKELIEKTGFKGPVACGFPARITQGIVKNCCQYRQILDRRTCRKALFRKVRKRSSRS